MEITQSRWTLEVEAKAAVLEDKNQELQRFTYTVSHDLKSPLFTIKGFLGMLVKDVGAGREKRIEEDVSHIDAAVGKMERLLDELLELSRIGRMDNEPVAVDLAEVVGEALELVAGRIAEREVEVEVAAESAFSTASMPTPRAPASVWRWCSASRWETRPWVTSMAQND
jgi:signal transduction histidine kinase